MISEKYKDYCCENPLKIENYQQAREDRTHTWKLHHRNEIQNFGGLDRSILIRLGLWRRRPASELIFLPKPVHAEMHANVKRTWKRGVFKPLRQLLLLGKRLDEITAEDIERMAVAMNRVRTSFRQLLSYCTNPTSKLYHVYGGKGIGICEEWMRDRSKFVDWVMRNGYAPGKDRRKCSVRRIDKSKDFSPENCYVMNRTGEVDFLS